MNIKTRIASTAAIFTFGLAAFGGAVVAVATPASATPDASGATSSSSSSGGDDTGTVRVNQAWGHFEKSGVTSIAGRPNPASSTGTTSANNATTYHDRTAIHRGVRHGGLIK